MDANELTQEQIQYAIQTRNCPVCKGPMQYLTTEEAKKHGVKGKPELYCSHCHLSIPVKN